MKKITVLAALAMLLALAVPANATDIKFSGYLKVFHENDVNYLRSTTSNGQDSDSFFTNKLQVTVDIIPTEDISIRWVMRSVNNVRWGAIGIGGGGPDTTGIFTRSLHARVAQPWGTLYIGRVADNLPGNAGGLFSLGYRRTFGAEYLNASNIFDISNPLDSVVYEKDFDNGFGLVAYYGKYTIPPVLPPAPPTNINLKDQDKDIFGIEPRFKWDGGGAALGIEYHRDMTPIYGLPAPEKNYAFFINPAITQAWGPFSVSFEAKLGFGKSTFRPGSGLPDDHLKAKGLGLFLDATYTYDSGNVSLLSFYVDGNSLDDLNAANPKLNNLVGVGDFYPYLVAFQAGAFGVGYFANAANMGYIGTGVSTAYVPPPPANRPFPNTGPNSVTNVWSIGLLGNHRFNSDVRINYGVGFFRLVNQTYVNQSKNLGVEFDVGAVFQILDNLSFESQFGYLVNGAAYKTFVGADKPKGTYSWANVLAVTF
jgi:hypothetical protein